MGLYEKYISGTEILSREWRNGPLAKQSYLQWVINIVHSERPDKVFVSQIVSGTDFYHIWVGFSSRPFTSTFNHFHVENYVRKTKHIVLYFILFFYWRKVRDFLMKLAKIFECFDFLIDNGKTSVISNDLN